jgi:hypothetical protein
MIFFSDEGRITTKIAPMKSTMARMEGRTMEIKNRCRLLRGISVNLKNFKVEAVCIKDTKSAAQIIAGYRWNPNDYRKSVQKHFPVAIMLYGIGSDGIESSYMGMPGKAEAAIILFHQLKMGTELLGALVKAHDTAA